MLNLILFLIFGAIITSIVAHTVIVYRRSTETGWKRLWATSRDSANWFWNKVLLIVGLLIEAMAQASDFFNMPDVSAFIHEKVPVNILAYVLLAIAAMGFASRARTIFWKRD